MGPSWPLGGSVRVLAPWAPDIELPCGFLDRAPHHIPSCGEQAQAPSHMHRRHPEGLELGVKPLGDTGRAIGEQPLCATKG